MYFEFYIYESKLALESKIERDHEKFNKKIETDCQEFLQNNKILEEREYIT